MRLQQLLTRRSIHPFPVNLFKSYHLNLLPPLSIHLPRMALQLSTATDIFLQITLATSTETAFLPAT